MAVEVDLLADRYEVGRMLGQGGMAQVFEGHDRLLDRRVAIKILKTRFAHDAEFLARFKREARAAASLAHAGIVAVYDSGEDGDRQFIVMEYAEGRTLADILKIEGALAPDDAVEIASEMCAALAHAHARGLIHRDVKPANTNITPDGSVKVMDFGIARAVEDATMITTTAGIIGTPRYMSPEQVDGRPLDPRSDLYALGVCLYECLTGVVPFDGTSAIMIAARHLNEPPRPLREVRPDVPASLDAVTMKALEKDPADRYQTAEEFALALDDLSSQETVPLAVPVAAADTVPMPEPEPEPERPPASRGRMAAFAALLVVLAVAGFALARWGLGRDPADTAPDESASEIAVPLVAGFPQEQAVAALQEAGLTVAGVQQQPSDEFAAGIALGTDPGAETLLSPGQGVTLLVSSGPAPEQDEPQQGSGAAPAPAAPSTPPSAPPTQEPTEAPSATAEPSPDPTDPTELPTAPTTPPATPSELPTTPTPSPTVTGAE